MPPSQLKALKSQLRDKGLTGPQKSKKQKKSSTSTVPRGKDRQTALQSVRDAFNPFELRLASSRPAKFPSTSLSNTGKYAAVLHCPGAAKSAGEEARRRTLLPEMRRRGK
ncbi:nucleolar complex protein 14, partial [Teratosphaeriaceae sp. CCFEE 6253]